MPIEIGIMPKNYAAIMLPIQMSGGNGYIWRKQRHKTRHNQGKASSGRPNTQAAGLTHIHPKPYLPVGDTDLACLDGWTAMDHVIMSEYARTRT